MGRDRHGWIDDGGLPDAARDAERGSGPASRGWFPAVWAAVMLLGVVLGAGCVPGDGPGATAVVSPTDAQTGGRAAPGSTDRPTTPPRETATSAAGSTTPGGAAPANASPQSTLRAWAAALARGDSDGAWELLTQATRDGLGRDEFERMAPGLAETWGMWVAGDQAVMYTHEYAPGPTVDYIGIPYHVITVVSPRSGEVDGQRAHSIVVGWRGGPDWRGSGDYGIVIALPEDTGDFRILSPTTEGGSVASSTSIRVTLPIDSELAVWVDDVSVGRGAMNIGPRADTVFTVECSLAPGEHVVTVAWFRVSAVYGTGANVVRAVSALVFDAH